MFVNNQSPSNLVSQSTQRDNKELVLPSGKRCLIKLFRGPIVNQGNVHDMANRLACRAFEQFPDSKAVLTGGVLKLTYLNNGELQAVWNTSDGHRRKVSVDPPLIGKVDSQRKQVLPPKKIAVQDSQPRSSTTTIVKKVAQQKHIVPKSNTEAGQLHQERRQKMRDIMNEPRPRSSSEEETKHHAAETTSFSISDEQALSMLEQRRQKMHHRLSGSESDQRTQQASHRRTLSEDEAKHDAAQTTSSSIGGEQALSMLEQRRQNMRLRLSGSESEQKSQQASHQRTRSEEEAKHDGEQPVSEPKEVTSPTMSQHTVSTSTPKGSNIDRIKDFFKGLFKKKGTHHTVPSMSQEAIPVADQVANLFRKNNVEEMRKFIKHAIKGTYFRDERHLEVMFKHISNLKNDFTLAKANVKEARAAYQDAVNLFTEAVKKEAVLCIKHHRENEFNELMKMAFNPREVYYHDPEKLKPLDSILTITTSSPQMLAQMHLMNAILQAKQDLGQKYKKRSETMMKDFFDTVVFPKGSSLQKDWTKAEANSMVLWKEQSLKIIPSVEGQVPGFDLNGCRSKREAISALENYIKNEKELYRSQNLLFYSIVKSNFLKGGASRSGYDQFFNADPDAFFNQKVRVPMMAKINAKFNK